MQEKIYGLLRSLGIQYRWSSRSRLNKSLVIASVLMKSGTVIINIADNLFTVVPGTMAGTINVAGTVSIVTGCILMTDIADVITYFGSVSLSRGRLVLTGISLLLSGIGLGFCDLLIGSEASSIGSKVGFIMLNLLAASPTLCMPIVDSVLTSKRVLKKIPNGLLLLQIQDTRAEVDEIVRLRQHNIERLHSLQTKNSENLENKKRLKQEILQKEQKLDILMETRKALVSRFESLQKPTTQDIPLLAQGGFSKESTIKEIEKEIRENKDSINGVQTDIHRLQLEVTSSRLLIAKNKADMQRVRQEIKEIDEQQLRPLQRSCTSIRDELNAIIVIIDQQTTHLNSEEQFSSLVAVDSELAPQLVPITSSVRHAAQTISSMEHAYAFNGFIEWLSLIQYIDAEGARNSFGLESYDVPYEIGNCLFEAVAAYTGRSGVEMRALAVTRIGGDMELQARITALARSKNTTIRLASGEDVTYDSLENYVEYMGREQTWGTEIELVALARALQRPIAIIPPEAGCTWIIEEPEYAQGDPIFIEYQGNNHYVPLAVTEDPRGTLEQVRARRAEILKENQHTTVDTNKKQERAKCTLL